MQCVMPFIHMNIKPNETATACWRCVEGLGNYTENNLEDIWYGDQWQEFRRQHLAGEKPKACNSCWEMEEAGIITGSSLRLDYRKLGYAFIAYVGIFLNKTSQTQFVLERINEIPFVTVAHVTTGKFNIFCKIRAKNTSHAKDIIYQIDDIEGVTRTETMISLEESINDKKRLMHSIFNEIK